MLPGVDGGPRQWTRIAPAVAGLVVAGLALGACGGRNEPIGTSAPVVGFFGSAVSDEPRATLAARDILANNGSAVDAAVTLAFTLAVTLPSRAGLGGGGVCLVHDNRAKKTEALVFLPAPAAGDPRVGVPAFARGLFALHARYGRLRWEQLTGSAESLARFGHPVSRALARDLAAHGQALASDPRTAALYRPDGRLLGEGEALAQVELSTILNQLRSIGPGDLYMGRTAHAFAEATLEAGFRLEVADLRAYTPDWKAPIALDAGNEVLFAAPEPVAGGRLAAAAWRARGAGAVPAGASPGGEASTGFVTTDRSGSAVACALTMGRPFGLARLARGTGVLLAPPADEASSLALAPLLQVNRNVNELFLALSAAGGADAGPLAAATARRLADEPAALDGALRTPRGTSTARLNVTWCPGGAPRRLESCSARTDPNGSGLAASADR